MHNVKENILKNKSNSKMTQKWKLDCMYIKYYTANPVLEAPITDEVKGVRTPRHRIGYGLVKGGIKLGVMDSSKTHSVPNPRETAKPLSILFWWWTIDLFKKGYTKVLTVEDLYDPLKIDRSSILGDRLERKWEAQLKKTEQLKTHKPSLTKAIVLSFRKELFIMGTIHVLLEFVLSYVNVANVIITSLREVHFFDIYLDAMQTEIDSRYHTHCIDSGDTLRVSSQIARLAMPVFLGLLLQYFSVDSTSTYQDALVYAGALSLNSLFTVISANHMLFISNYLGGRIRIAICSLVYRKALKLSKTALGETAPGKIVNLVANDVNRFEVVMWFLHFMWTAPISVIIVAYILYTKAKFAALFGVLVFLMVVPIQVYMSKLSSKHRLQTAIKTDERIRLMDEIISGVQVIKMYAWEKPFCALVELARHLELKVVRKSSYIRGIYMTFFLFTTRLALYVTIVSLLAYGEKITAVKIFMISSFYNYLANTLTSMFVRGFAELSECKVSVSRIQSFLMLEEFKEGSVNQMDQMNNGNRKHSDLVISEMQRAMVLDSEEMRKEFTEEEDDILLLDDGLSVKMDNVTAKWCPSASDNTLENINLNLERGKLYIVIGMVGSGKSSFLSSLLGELNLINGSIHLRGNVSYVDQETWVFGASVRQNIIFGESFDRQRYQRVVKACSLFKDFAQFPEGDHTIVGERGSSLSGGQKARINLARAVYKQADVYLLDDPLSAVDAHVGRHLFDECIRRYLRGKTRILATHQLQFVKEVDGIILFDQSRVQYFDNYHRLLDKYPEYNCLIAADKEGKENAASARTSMFRCRFSSSNNKFSRISESCEVPEANGVNDDSRNLKDIIESSSRGITKGSMFIKYFQYGSNLCMVVVMCLLFIATQLFVSVNDYGVNYLVNAEESRDFYASRKIGNKTNRTAIIAEDCLLPSNIYVYIYTTIVLSILVIGLIRSFFYYILCLRSNERLHNSAFAALIRTSMRFFDMNPSGRILNRFSKDTTAIDELLPKAILDSGQVMLMIVGALIVTCCINPIFTIPAIIISIVCYWLRKIYLKTSKHIKRLEGMTRSPVFTHLNATLNGIATIRAYKAQTILKEEFDKFQDIHTSSWYMFTASSMAYAFFADTFVFGFTTFITFSFLFFKDNFNGAQVGLAITQMMSIAGYVQWGMRQSAEVTNQMMSVERILEYTQIPPEKNLRDEFMGPTRKKKKQYVTSNSLIIPPKEWPDRGVVEFVNVYLKYSDDDLPVLSALNFRIEPTQKIGIVGRTGAGKSSLITALYRLAQIEGVIKIDDIDTGTIPVEELRSRISIIPQDPVLFSGTLRRNLDPFNDFDDKILWEALEEVELKDSIAALGNGLDSRVFDRGLNFSVGQRQLVCLARAVLRKNRILMLDEATANVDPQTDALIQRTIRTKFASCTVLTVAHRLNTIIDSDKVIVMDKGHVTEFDHPYVLLQKSKSQFTALVKETGPAMFEHLYQLAKQCYNNMNNIHTMNDDNK